MSRRRKLLIGVLIAALLGVATGATYYVQHRSQATPKPAAAAKPSPAQPKAAAAPLDPIEIDAIKARSYPGSAFTVTSDLGNQGAYTAQTVSYQSDGLTINALLATPTTAKPAAGWPVIVLDHGYINPSVYQTNSSDYRSFIQAFTAAGYMVVKPDFRGHGTSQGVAEGGHFSPVYAYDNLNLIASIKQTENIDKTRIGLFGHSMGGHVALRTAVVSPDIKTTVLMAGVVGSMNDLANNWPNSPMPGDQPTEVTRAKKADLIQKFGNPTPTSDFWNKASAINYVKDIKGPVQINQDVNDSTVPKLFSDNLDAAMKAVGKSDEYNTYPGDDHQFTANRTAFLNNVLAFYKKNL